MIRSGVCTCWVGLLCVVLWVSCAAATAPTITGVPTPTNGIVCTEITAEGEPAVMCDGRIYLEDSRDSAGTTRFYIDVAVSVFLVLFAGIMSGLTVGLLGLDPLKLHLLVSSGSGTPSECRQAARILPLLKRKHLLLCTLLINNAAAMEMLPIFLDRMLGPVLAIAVSVSAVLMFGEIIPQAVCTRFGIAVGGRLTWLVWALIFISFPIAYPISKLLDCLLGHSDFINLYQRNELKELVGLHESCDGDHMSATSLSGDEVTVIRGALDLKEKQVEAVMTPIDKCFMLPLTDKLDRSTMERILREGFSRVPVYRGTVEDPVIIGFILVKSLILLDPDDEVPIREAELHRMPIVSTEDVLYELLDVFQCGVHMAMVLDAVDRRTVRGFITLEDIIEELIGEEIVDESDAWIDVARQIRVAKVIEVADMHEKVKRASFEVDRLSLETDEDVEMSSLLPQRSLMKGVDDNDPFV